MSNILNIKSDWDDKTVKFRNKMSQIYDLNNKTNSSTGTYNPFLNKNGELLNPYIDYQKILDNSRVNQKVKDYIQTATGLTPTVQKAKEVFDYNNSYTSNAGNSSAFLSDTNAIKYSADTEVKQTNQSPNVENGIVSSAKKYIGTPYVWGGESMSEGGMDCSGFVYAALKDAGYNIGRTTAQGYRSKGTIVDRSNMQPGDLVFFGSNDNASHIGIYIGNGQMIHSSGGSKNTKSNPGKGVTIANVDYRNDFIEARRY